MPVDVHEVDDPYHPETKQFPPHNIRELRDEIYMVHLQQLYEDKENEFIGWIKHVLVHLRELI